LISGRLKNLLCGACLPALAIGLFIAALGAAAPCAIAQQGTRDEATDKSEPIQPRFYSLKSNPVNLRKGPGTQYPKVWIFRREGLPVEVLREHGRWRQVRDSDGATGWILRTLISQRRTALVTPWILKEKPESPEMTALRSGPRQRASTVAKLEAGTLVGIKSCDRNWCHVSIADFRGYVEQNRLWGVYPKEVLK
jgi:SH3-like domain-containing protein